MSTIERYGSDLAFADLVDLAVAEPWGDGFPFAPLTESALAEALALTGLAGDATVAEFSPATASELCSLALLAGCTPAYVPTVVAAAQAIDAMVARSGRERALDPEASQVLIINGPARAALDVNCGIGAFGPGWRANATIGRAVRLVVRHAGVGHAAAFGDPGQYSFCFGEDEEGSAWTPMHVERGFGADQSTVTVHSCTKAGRNFDRTSTLPEDHAKNIALFLRDSAGATDWFGDDPLSIVFVISHEWRRLLLGGGWSKADLREHLFPLLVGDELYGRPLRVSSPDDLVIAASGGPAEATEWCLVGRTAPQTQVISAAEEATS